MLCPHCKIDLQTLTLKSTNIDICPLCYGIWLDNGELEKLIATDKNELKSSSIGKTSETITKDEKPWEGEITCPKCGKLMPKYRYAVTSDIFIDGCAQGCGIWLDKGEILRIADYLINVDKPLTDTQKQQMKQRLRLLNAEKKKKTAVHPMISLLNKRYYSEDELEQDLETSPAGKYIGLVYAIIQVLAYFLLRKGGF